LEGTAAFLFVQNVSVEEWLGLQFIPLNIEVFDEITQLRLRKLIESRGYCETIYEFLV